MYAMLVATTVATVLEGDDKMEVIHTTAPISIENLKKYFTNKNTLFVIDYTASNLTGQKLLTYVGNLDIPVDIVNFDLEFVKDYLHSVSIVTLPALEKTVIDILFELKGITKTNNYSDFIADNVDILTSWQKKLDSLTLYNLYTVDASEFKTYAQSFPSNNSDSLEGINFVSLLKHEAFFEWFAFINDDDLSFYNKYFNEYMFKGKNLYSFWANENNPMFLLTWGIASGTINSEEFKNATLA